MVRQVGLRASILHATGRKKRAGVKRRKNLGGLQDLRGLEISTSSPSIIWLCPTNKQYRENINGVAGKIIVRVSQSVIRLRKSIVPPSNDVTCVPKTCAKPRRNVVQPRKSFVFAAISLVSAQETIAQSTKSFIFWPKIKFWRGKLLFVRAKDLFFLHRSFVCQSES